MPRKGILRRLQRVTQWMSIEESTWGWLDNSRSVMDRGSRNRPRRESVQSPSSPAGADSPTAGQRPARSSCWPGGIRSCWVSDMRPVVHESPRWQKEASILRKKTTPSPWREVVVKRSLSELRRAGSHNLPAESARQTRQPAHRQQSAPLRDPIGFFGPGERRSCRDGRCSSPVRG